MVICRVVVALTLSIQPTNRTLINYDLEKFIITLEWDAGSECYATAATVHHTQAALHWLWLAGWLVIWLVHCPTNCWLLVSHLFDRPRDAAIKVSTPNKWHRVSLSVCLSVRLSPLRGLSLSLPRTPPSVCLCSSEWMKGGKTAAAVSS